MKRTGTWSESLVERTRRDLSAIYEWAMVQDELHLKNLDGRFGRIGIKEVSAGTMHIEDKDSSEVYRYGSINEVIAAGWALD